MKKLHRRHIFISSLVISCFFVLFWLWTPSDLSNPNCKFEQNAAWVSVDWVSESVDETAVRHFAESADSHGLQYLFLYVSYLKPDGSFNSSYNYAGEFIKAFRRFNKNTRLLAWVGLPLTNNRSIGIQGWVDLSEPGTRQRIVRFMGDLTEEFGFDGVHINAETVQNNDNDFLNLLDEVRQKIGKDKILSIAGSHWVPQSLNVLPLLRNFRWTGPYYREIGQRVQQIVTMSYDSYTFHPVLYRFWVREQAKGISNSLENVDVELLIGISVSQEKTRSHWPAVENLENGLAGVCSGLTDDSILQGVAIYADWDFSKSDWEVWQLWQR